MLYTLPTSIEISGRDYEIRTDFRVILDIIEMLNDVELDNNEKVEGVLDMFFVDGDDIFDYQAAWDGFVWFLNCGQEEDNSARRQPKLIDWEHDFQMIISPVNRIAGKEIREVPYDFDNNAGGIHWWTFLGYYNEIGDCYFAQVVGIRNKKAKGKKLDKSDQEFYKNHRADIELKVKRSKKEEEDLLSWLKIKKE